MEAETFAAIVLGCCIGATIAVGCCSIRAHILAAKKQTIEGYWSEEAQTFLEEMQAEDFKILDTQIAALTKELGEESYQLSLAELDLTLAFIRAQAEHAEQAEDKAVKAEAG